MAQGRPHPPAVKAAVLADIATGESLSRVSRKHGVSRTTVSMWRDSAQMNTSTAVVREKGSEIGEQLYGYLEESIATLVAQLRFARDPNWLARQNAADLAIFMGVAADKATRLLAAFRPAPDSDEPAVIDIPGSSE